MAVETPVEVLAVTADSVTLRALGACAGCAGCAGRCGLGWYAGREVSLPRCTFGDLAVPGRQLWLRSEAAGLRRRAVVGYGLPLAGLVAGALIGHLLAAVTGVALNPAVAAGALAGTLSGLLLSNKPLQGLPAIRVIEARSADEDDGAARQPHDYS